ncbi:MAG: hypothetical protein KBT03_06985 [Bacteroidales bacterium]|nr:hypothetical protein [Candidatus Scybalousia scybalohippi]
MKKRLMMAMMLIASAFAFTACGDDDNTDNNNGNGSGSGNTGIQSSINETDNSLVLTITMPQMYTMTITTNFREDECVSAEGKVECYSAYVCDIMWENLVSEIEDEEELALYHRDGNTIFMNMTDEFVGSTKAEVRMIFQYMTQGMNGENPFAKIKRIVA